MPGSLPPFAPNSTSSVMPKSRWSALLASSPMDTLAAFTQAGVNRISLGVQSFIDREAHQSGRLHSRAIVLNDLRRLRSAGITNLNLDLIAGLADQTFASWQESLSVLLDTSVPHASIYMLEVDDDSRLGRELMAGGVRYHAEFVPTDDSIARMYETAVESFAAAGLPQYEISNFARPGFESRHNLRYWQRSPYLGLGLDASSMLRATPRSSDFREPGLCPSIDDDGRPEVLSRSLSASRNGLAFARSPTRGGLVPRPAPEPGSFCLGSSPGVRQPNGCACARHRRKTCRTQPAYAFMTEKPCALTPQGRLLSNDVLQEFLEIANPPVSLAGR